MNEPIITAQARKRERTIAYALLGALAYFPLFMNLDVLPLRMWDESRQAVSAYEMLHNGNWLVNHYNGTPDMWSTKPPLLVWLQALGFAVLGPGELALRLPSAIAGLLICFLLVRITDKQLGSPWLGFFAGLVVLTSRGFIDMHVARSGDYDALLTLLMFWAAINAFRYSLNGSRVAVLSLFAALALGVLTKSVQALMMVPGILIWWIISKRLVLALKDRWFWIGISGFLLIVAAFYLGREALNPGYLQAVWDNEVGGRYGSSLEGHTANGLFYLANLAHHHFDHWYVWALAGCVIGLASKDAMLRKVTGFAALLAVQYLVVISNSGTKTGWYDAPLFPFLGILAAIPMYMLFAWCRASAWINERLLVNVLPWTLVACLFFGPYLQRVEASHIPQEEEWDVDRYALPKYLQFGAKGKRPIDATAICWEDYDAHVLFYTYLLNEQGNPIRRVDKGELLPGMTALASEWQVKEYIEQHYTFVVTEEEPHLKVYAIQGVKHGQP